MTPGRSGCSSWPQRVFLLDVDQDTRKARTSSAARERTEDRIEARGDAFHQAVRQAYLELAAADPRIQVVDATGSVDAVQARLRQETAELLGKVRS